MNNKTNHTDFHSGKRMLVKGKMKKDRALDSFDFNVSDEHVATDDWLANAELMKKDRDLDTSDEHVATDNSLSDNDWSNKKRLKFSRNTVKKHLSNYKKAGVRRNYRGIDKRFDDDPELFKRYLESILEIR